MKQIFEITDKDDIKEVLDGASYGTLALCENEKPYSVPINFVEYEENIYFHGSFKGKKADILKKNSFASFSVVEPCALIPSYFSSNEGLACPATHFFKSVIIDGVIEFVENKDEKIDVLTKLMQKLQPEGNYKPLNENEYEKIITATCVYKLIPTSTRAKFKFGQHLNRERFEMIINHLEKRGSKTDIKTIKLMKKFKNKQY